MIRLDGGDPTVSDGLRIASSRVVQISVRGDRRDRRAHPAHHRRARGFIGRWIVGCSASHSRSRPS
jgi:hypothetical protein